MLEKWKRAFTSCPSGRWQTDTVYRIMHQMCIRDRAHPIRMINNHSVAVADFMKECGVVRKGKYNDCIDYLSNEFDFCGHLADGGTLSVPSDIDAAERLQAFADEHLLSLIHIFSEAWPTQPFLYERLLCIDPILSNYSWFSEFLIHGFPSF